MKPLLITDRIAVLHGEAADIATVLAENSIDALITDPPSGISFMGKAWDDDKGGREQWVAWLATILREAYRVMKPGAHGLVWALPRTSHWTATACEDAGFEVRDRVSAIFLNGFPKSLNVSKEIDKLAGATREITGVNPTWREAKRTNQVFEPVRGASAMVLTAPATDDARTWDGWGTALKPAVEDWWLIRKPLEMTVARNVLKHGTGALNIGACRIGTEDTRAPTGERPDNGWGMAPGAIAGSEEGRWPPHLIVGDGVEVNDIDDPARYFYCPKPPKKETEAGLDHLPIRSGGEATDREDGSAGLKNARAGAGRGGGRRNTHPTKKSIALMRWLVRLITPPGGTVLDIFAGTGTTGIAALLEGADAVLVEQGGPDDEYLPILEGRIRHALADGFAEFGDPPKR